MLEPDPIAAPVVKLIFEMAADGKKHGIIQVIAKCGNVGYQLDRQ